MTVAITDEFDDLRGRWANYDTNDLSEFNALRGRAHTNLRSFGSAIYVDRFIRYMALPMDDLNDLSMEDLEAPILLEAAEPWTDAVTEQDDTNRSLLRIDVPAGETVTAESTRDAVDLTGWQANDTLTLSLPNFPADDLDLDNCRLELVQGGNTTSLPFPSPILVGNTEVSWPMSELGNFLRPTTVRIILAATNTCTVRVAALRVLSSTWTPTALDTDTLQGRLAPTVARDGSIPADRLPRLWRSADVPGLDDPRPINARLSVNLFTGSMNEQNSFTLFFRGHREDYLTQLDLNGTDDGSFGENQASLRARNRQPDYGQAVYDPRPQADLSKESATDTQFLTQSELNALMQAELERLADTISESYLYLTMEWGTPNNRIIIGTTETQNDEERYYFDIPAGVAANELNAEGEYVLRAELEDHSLRARLFPVSTAGEIDHESMVLDTTAILNEFLIKRRKGRVGWEFDINDGDAWVESVRSRGLMFGELITNNFASLTPVEGAQIFTGATPDTVLTTGLETYRDATLTLDTYNAQSADGSFKIASKALTGIQTPLVVFEDFPNTQVEFDLFYPNEALLGGQNLVAGLLNPRGYFVALTLPLVMGGQWQHIRIPMNKATDEQVGSYRFILMSDADNVTWWIDNLVISQVAVRWAGRAVVNDPWGRFNNRWTDFMGHVNTESDGALFPERGSYLQVRGQALTQSATIDKLHIKPKYAQLGRLTWDVGRKYRGNSQ